MRLYSFTNYYLSSLQHGLQTAHVVGELSRTFGYSNNFNEWLDDHRTIIIKSGGNQEALQNITTMFADPANPYPWAVFREDQASLAGAITAVGIVVPEKLYVLGSRFDRTDWELGLYDLIQRTPLAV